MLPGRLSGGFIDAAITVVAIDVVPLTILYMDESLSLNLSHLDQCLGKDLDGDLRARLDSFLATGTVCLLLADEDLLLRSCLLISSLDLDLRLDLLFLHVRKLFSSHQY